ncbi:MAG: hypothetical protein KGH72_05880 [Candidatus Micrarchaeota archaeon]|nr:hypothetical protein [Candidatus Micrarchaeota archaeon]
MTDYDGNQAVGSFYALLPVSGPGRMIFTRIYRVVFTKTQLLGLLKTEPYSSYDWEDIKSKASGNELVSNGNVNESNDDMEKADIKVNYSKIKEVKFEKISLFGMQTEATKTKYHVVFDAGLFDVIDTCMFVVDQSILDSVKDIIMSTPLSTKFKQ